MMRIDVVQATVPASGSLDPVRMKAIVGAGRAGTNIRVRLPKGAPTSITGTYDDAMAVPGVLAEIRAAAEEGADAVVVNCTADTGVDAAREAVTIPVVAVSQAALSLAAQLSDGFSVLTFAARIAPRFEAMAHRWGMAHRLKSVRSVETPLEDIADHGLLAEHLAREAELCIREDGAHAIILGCTDFELAADAMARHLQSRDIVIPLLRPFAIGVHLAEDLVAMRLSHSKLSFPKPRLA
jgi:allantoin racemase